MPNYDIQQLNDMAPAELLNIAEAMDIKNAKKLDKQATILAILDNQAVSSSKDVVELAKKERVKIPRKKIEKSSDIFKKSPKSEQPDEAANIEEVVSHPIQEVVKIAISEPVAVIVPEKKVKVKATIVSNTTPDMFEDQKNISNQNDQMTEVNQASEPTATNENEQEEVQEKQSEPINADQISQPEQRNNPNQT